jgi:ferredoxin--NADP+ reductase
MAGGNAAAGIFSASSVAALASGVACCATAAAVKKKGAKIIHGKEVPWNLFSPKAPYQAKVVKNVNHPQTLTEPTGDANWETCHVTFDHGGNVPYIEGQSIGLISPGPDKNGKSPARIRLYSIASSAVGDDETSKTVSLCVKRVVEVDGEHSNREVGEDKPDKAGTGFPDSKVYRGVCSNHVCDLSPGDAVQITGPTGAEMLLPEDPESNIIMLATGTGIAPMRSYLRLLFHDAAGANADGSRKFKGLAWVFLGVPYSKSLLYVDEHTTYESKYPGQFRFEHAVSREQKNEEGQKMYIQTRMAEYRDELWELMQDPKTHVYMCGLKGMEKGMAECFGPIAEKSGLEWVAFSKAMKKADRYHVEVY